LARDRLVALLHTLIEDAGSQCLPIAARLDQSVGGAVPMAKDICANGFVICNHHYPFQDKSFDMCQLIRNFAAAGRPN